MGEGSKRAALVLDVERASSTDAQHFANFPGLWIPGEPIAVAELGFETVKDAEARAEELGLPLRRTTVAADGGLMPAVAAGVEPGVDLGVFDGPSELAPVSPSSMTDPTGDAAGGPMTGAFAPLEPGTVTGTMPEDDPALVVTEPLEEPVDDEEPS